jgi:hypothetical protein
MLPFGAAARLDAERGNPKAELQISIFPIKVAMNNPSPDLNPDSNCPIIKILCLHHLTNPRRCFAKVPRCIASW